MHVRLRVSGGVLRHATLAFADDGGGLGGSRAAVGHHVSGGAPMGEGGGAAAGEVQPHCGTGVLLRHSVRGICCHPY